MSKRNSGNKKYLDNVQVAGRLGRLQSLTRRWSPKQTQLSGLLWSKLWPKQACNT